MLSIDMGYNDNLTATMAFSQATTEVTTCMRNYMFKHVWFNYPLGDRWIPLAKGQKYG